jgi:HflK protein
MHGKRFLHALHHALSWDGLHSFYSGLQRYQQEIRRWTFGLAAACWVLSGIALIGPEQAGVVLHFGRWTETLDPGIYYRWPWPIDAVARVAPKRIQAAEIGYRTNLNAPVPASEPQVYGWNIQHREGRYRKVPEEALMLTGDENLVEVNAVVQFSIADLSRYLFRSKEPETVIRAVAERALRLSVARESLDAILTDRRSDVEATWKEELEENLQAYGSGMRVLSVQLQDVHPPVEVVEAFRDVASALEERSTRINEAEAYLREQLPLARGQSKARLLSAEGYTAARVERSQGESLRFSERQKAYRLAPDVTASRLYFESIEQVLPNKTKYITDTKKLNQRRFIFVEAKDFGLLNLVEPKSSPPEAPK